MLRAIKVFLEFLLKLGEYFTRKQLIDAGKAEQAAAASTEVERRVEEANSAIATADPIRTERLRKRFDRNATATATDSSK